MEAIHRINGNTMKGINGDVSFNVREIEKIGKDRELPLRQAIQRALTETARLN